MDRDLLRGTIPTLVLSVLSEGPQYGYRIGEIIRSRTDQGLTLGLATLYNTLRALERQQLVRSYWRDHEGCQRPRHYYEILPEGREVLSRRLAEWRHFTRLADAVFEPNAV